MKLSSDFYIDEFLESETADRLGVPMSPPIEVVVGLTALTVAVLQPVRGAIDMALYISSGWRPMTVNRAVGGSDTSQHVLGEAADIYTDTLDPFDLAQRILNLNVDFGQLIVYPEKGTVHISYSRLGGNDRDVMTHKDGRFVPGLQRPEEG